MGERENIEALWRICIGPEYRSGKVTHWGEHIQFDEHTLLFVIDEERGNIYGK